jgi:hypothetical protein
VFASSLKVAVKRWENGSPSRQSCARTATHSQAFSHLASVIG